MPDPLMASTSGRTDPVPLAALAGRLRPLTAATGTGKTVSPQGLPGQPGNRIQHVGSPAIVERALILPPGRRIGPITADERKAIIASSAVTDTYGTAVDRDPAYEELKARVVASAGGARQVPATDGTAMKDTLGGLLKGSGRKDGIVEVMAKSAARTMGSTVVMQIVPGAPGSLFRGKR